MEMLMTVQKNSPCCSVRIYEYARNLSMSEINVKDSAEKVEIDVVEPEVEIKEVLTCKEDWRSILRIETKLDIFSSNMSYLSFICRFDHDLNKCHLYQIRSLFCHDQLTEINLENFIQNLSNCEFT
jgi:hypothetical protein